MEEAERELQDLLEDVAGALRAARSQIAQRGPGALRGAVSGLLVGGPAGALVGGALGAAGVGGGGVGVAATPAQIDGNAAATLLLALLRPEVAQALVALAAGRAGVASVPVAGVPVPVGAFANLIQSLAERAGVDHAGLVRGRSRMVPSYLADAFADGLDVSRSEIRAAALLELLADAAEDDAGADPELADDIDEADHAADLADLADLIRLGGFDP